MRVQFRERHVEHVAVDQANEAELFDDRHEVGGGNDPPLRRPHAQQTLVMIDDAGRGRDHRLKREDDALFAQRRLDLFAHRQAAPLARALLLGQPIMGVAVAPGALGFGECALGPGNDVVGGESLIRKGGAADRRRGIDRPAGGHHRCRADGGEDFFGGGADVVGATVRQHDPETIAAEATNYVADPHAGVEPAADLDQHRIGRLIAEHVVDRRHVVDADRQECRRAMRALIGGDDLVDRLAQPRLVEMAGQLVVVGEPFEPILLRLAVADGADNAAHDARPAFVVAGRPAALVHPHKGPFGIAQAVLAVEGALAVEMRGERQLPMHQIVGMQAIGETAAGRHLGGELDLCRSEPARPVELVAFQLPQIGDVPRGIESGGETVGQLVAANRHRGKTSIGFAICYRASPGKPAPTLEPDALKNH